MERQPIFPKGVLTTWDSDTESDAAECVSVPTVVQNLLHVYKRDVKAQTDLQIPHVNVQHVRKQFRAFFQKETQQIFSFLESPLSVSPTLSAAKAILQKYGNPSFQPARMKLRDLPLDTDCADIVEGIQTLLKPVSTGEPLQEWVSQTNLLLTLWRTSVTELEKAEQTLEKTLSAFQNGYQKAKTLLDLPSSPEYEHLANATESYIRTLFREQNLEGVFTDYCRILKQVIVLTDAIQAIRALVNSPTEPLCSICVLHPVTTALVPCGHTFCSVCGPRQALSCYICRQPVRETLKVFLS